MKELVFVNNNNEVVTDSLMVAEVFGKRHDNVMSDIRTQMEYAGLEFSLLNFKERTYENRGRIYPKLDMTEEAFTLVAMSYNTKESVQMKIKFINEFKRMKDHIKKQENVPLKPIDQIRLLMANSLETEERLATVETNVEKLQNTMTIDYGQQVVLDNAKKKRVEYLWGNLKVKGIHDTKRKLYAQFGKDLKRAFAVPSYRDISAKDFEEAMKFTKGWRPHLV
ncbi:TPA: Rha family transcriptional regulator [Bacillus anthracis]|nr:ORF6C domain-containing protein [Bacillus cereus biovar anthracis]HDR6230943.1 ORF6C domain-containing protein [Bacillus cereus biovar anthracis]HDR6240470.1 ORF6C domain-containing protein [Bacillus cereus biovar anthracis]HDR6252414.1 ORF6C domain-containing protein [Bacillus cereus biovar anthracis]HDR6254199.1 ORF6C domain-containing protein [Bacillus cereus biovar anthracis]